MLTSFFKHKLMPAITFHNIEDVLPVTNALQEGGLDVMEITFRTGIAAKAIELVRKNFPEMIVGAGTLLNSEQLAIAVQAGASFGVAPGLNEKVIGTAAEKNFPFIPGIITASELEKALTLGCRLVKIFPCNLSGGIGLIRALQSPYAHTGIQFIPMGGINLSNLHEYTALNIVLAAGGSWIASEELIGQKGFDIITENVRCSIAITR
ncbi:bifunctional 4-hydroxy-2-oxoglutarate aldolase/2-dehydro-3-deoxy-phosphogluconate aldolase [Chitinophaga sp. 22321]|uniref:2-dehydro-3-deoxy-phosphogluconate aldolase n=1 Tax=Chitinophaga hostae TaxID=2831022 RepID=A0ABS5IXT1_9BACT|nr:bifunctional 4-hydroxy-2-oxoglutarate aldolase/2-dehydro-3-deoxy-phosphogluconate aldolase [Chitinophaga hostae]MBS0027690.1 bifunctional 4-hydroxy-2-oxoglutarate aldolase/2-dehydro-3-deoxy-phosphogluconate aldolase [Chitinophaga hostae]